MKRIFLILALLLIIVLGRSQEYYVSPAYYPIDMETVALPVDMGARLPDIEFGSALPGWFEKHGRGFGVIGYHIGTIALGAIADGLYDDGHKDVAHALHAVEIGAALAGPFIFHVKKSEALSYLLSYGFLRFTFFDGIYNTTRGLPLLYNGSTSTYDDVMSAMPDDGKVFVKSISFVAGVSIPLKSL